LTSKEFIERGEIRPLIVRLDSFGNNIWRSGDIARFHDILPEETHDSSIQDIGQNTDHDTDASILPQLHIRVFVMVGLLSMICG
jgi:hypothetical protein